MSEVFDPLNLLLLAIAVVIFIRLRGALGRRTGHERRRYDSFGALDRKDGHEGATAGKNGVILLPDHDKGAEDSDEPGAPVWKGYAEESSALAKALQAMARADNDFQPASFLEGAKLAYEAIVMAFQQGDLKALRPLLSQDVYNQFAKSMAERKKAGQTVEAHFVGVKEAVITSGELENRKAVLTVRLVGELITVTKDREGRIVEGDPKHIREMTDIWSFMRDVTTDNPNWTLVATGSDQD